MSPCTNRCLGSSSTGIERVEIAGVGELVQVDDAKQPLGRSTWRTRQLPIKPAPPVIKMECIRTLERSVHSGERDRPRDPSHDSKPPTPGLKARATRSLESINRARVVDIVWHGQFDW